MGFFQKVFDLLMMLREDGGFPLSPERMLKCITAADNITEMEDFFYRIQSLVCHSEEEISKYRETFFLWYTGKQYIQDGEIEEQIRNLQNSANILRGEVDKEQNRISGLENGISQKEQKIRDNARDVEQYENDAKEAEQQIERLKKERDEWTKKTIGKSRKELDAEATSREKKNSKEIKSILTKLKKDVSAIFKEAKLQKKDYADISFPAGSEWSQVTIDPNEVSRKYANVTKEVGELLNALLKNAARERIAKNMPAFNAYLAACETAKKAKSDIEAIAKSVKKELKSQEEIAGADQRFKGQIEAQNKHIKRYKSMQAAAVESSKRLEAEISRDKETIESIEKANAQRMDDASAKDAMRQQAILEKDKAVKHRELFIGSRSVWDRERDETLMTTPITRMSQEERTRILEYIRSNARIFKNTMRRTNNVPHSRRVDIKKTIRLASRTGGEPCEVAFKRPRPSHAKVVCLVDISGSCRNASTLALYFMALMNDVFPLGCHKFAFVNTLYDLDALFKGVDADEGVNRVLATIPSRGYSDYGTPIETLANEYAGIFTKETTFLIIGDARNNSRKPKDDLFANICSHCRNVFWLNTDDVAKWNTGDSIIGTYEKAGAKVSAVSTVGQLLNFLVSMSA